MTCYNLCYIILYFYTFHSFISFCNLLICPLKKLIEGIPVWLEVSPDGVKVFAEDEKVINIQFSKLELVGSTQNTLYIIKLDSLHIIHFKVNNKIRQFADVINTIILLVLACLYMYIDRATLLICHCLPGPPRGTWRPGGKYLQMEAPP